MAKQKLFRKAEVFGRKVPIYKIPGLRREGCFGYFHADTKRIGIDAHLAGPDLEHTVIHEMFHAILDRLHIQQQMPPEFVEVLVENLSAGVIDNYNLEWKK